MSLITRVDEKLTRPNRRKMNFTPYHSEENPGHRANWFHGSMAVLACLLTYMMTTMHYNGSFFAGSVFADIVLAVLLFPSAFAAVLCWHYRHKAFAKVVGALDVVFTLVFVTFLSQIGLHAAWSVFFSIILLAVFIACLVGATFTRWVPLGRDYEDRSVRKSRKATETD